MDSGCVGDSAEGVSALSSLLSCQSVNPLSLRLHVQGRRLFGSIRHHHAQALLSRIFRTVDGLVEALDDSQLERVSAFLSDVPSDASSFQSFVRRLLGDASESGSIPWLLQNLHGIDGIESFVASLESDWALLSQLTSDPSPDGYAKIARADPECAGAVLRDHRSSVGAVSDDDLAAYTAFSQSDFRQVRLRNFVKIHQVGQGAYGDVWLAEDIVNKVPVALKKLKLNEDREGFPKSAIREIVLLNTLKHRNIVNLLGIAHSRSDGESGKDHVWMVFEYLPFDLSGYIEALRDPSEKRDKLTKPLMWLSIGEIKSIMHQLLRAVSFCHRNNVLHRDLKTANLLMKHDGTIKLADFGLARVCPTGKGMLTNRVVTLWYRPPELLLGSDNYDSGVDMWSVGCIMAELVCGTHIFAADKEPLILKLIAERLGLPTESDLKFLKTLPLWNEPLANPLHPDRQGTIVPRKKEFEKTFKITNELGDEGWDFMRQLFAWTPGNRISARKALQHPWFSVEPLPSGLISRANVKAAHSFMTKNQRKRESQKQPLKRHEYVKYANTGHIRKALEKQRANAQEKQAALNAKT
ncbi:protein kinase domain containing protein, putative [Babesia bigemina]|uniref:Cyclin-dependent kinase 2 homolog n=1 Tax=Babesia bigemina TaxID=5866 RepID=A0A061D482_BABBI|nr:protein kinase domain containing protein, putative [Babesia bigemina]CDR95551.1 protein kinase domain containing protein, putative [Babesia bigemina]|eukprot:XP_012767737.1 protein kinase domain containing protein, putative [Babesia bigemina]